MERLDDRQRIAELEKQLAELRRQNALLQTQVEEFRAKEQTISSAIIASMEHAKQLEASRKKLYSLDIQRSRLMYLRMDQIINDLYRRYPELRKENSLREMSEKFKTMVFNDLTDKTVESPSYDVKQPVDDPIKKLLRNIIDCFDDKKPSSYKKSKEPSYEAVKKEDKQVSYNLNLNIPKNDTAPTITSSGFDINEALHPTMELDEIMKAFNLGKKDD